MNRKFVKRNKWLVLALCVGSLIALVLAVYAIILLVEWSVASSNTQKLKKEIETINKRQPGPGDENARELAEDIAFYQKKLAALFSQCRGPMDSAVEAFLAVLDAPLAEKLTEEEVEAYKLKSEENEIADENENKPAKVVIAKLDKKSFRKFFKDRFDKYLDKAANSDEERHSNVLFTSFISEFKEVFPKDNWDKAVNKFMETASKLTIAPIEDANKEAMLINAMGFERFVDSDPMRFQRYMGNFAAKVQKCAEEKQLRMVGNALNFLIRTQSEAGGNSSFSGESSLSAMSPADYALVLFQWDIFSDIVQRVSANLGDKGGVLYGVTLRSKGGSSGGDEMGMGNQSAGLNPENYFENEGGYKVYHYTLEMSVEMEQLRQIVKNLDMGYKDNRTYVVRSWSLYAENNGAAILMKQVETNADKVEEQKQTEERSGRSFRRRRGRRLDMGEAAPRAEKRSPQAEPDKELTEEEQEALEAQKPPHERRDYGAILIGGEVNRKCRVFIDVDYLVREENQE